MNGLLRYFYLGEFASSEALWERYPAGGIEGEYVKIAGVEYGWDKYGRRWALLDASGGGSGEGSGESSGSDGHCCCCHTSDHALIMRIENNSANINTLFDRIDGLQTSDNEFQPIESDSIDNMFN